MKSKKWVRFIVCGCFFLFLSVLVLSDVNAAPEKPKSLRMGSNTVGSIMYAFAGGLSAVVEKYSDLKIEVLPHGNVITLPMFATKECDMVIAASDEMDAAFRGIAVYEKITGGKGVDLRMMMLGTRIAAGLLVARDTGIKTTRELKGKRVCLDYGTHYALAMGSRAALFGGGLTLEDVIAVKANGVPEAMRKVLEGKADACYGAIGVPAFRELEAARGARHLGIENTPERWQEIHKIFHGYFPMHIEPKKPGQPVGVMEPIWMVGRNFSLVCRADLPDDIVYATTKALYEHDAELGPFHPGLKDWAKERFVGTMAPAPYHAGAIRFYKEKGLWTDEMEQHQEELFKNRTRR
jgi:TRAP transporter TAXI family solute receptor